MPDLPPDRRAQRALVHAGAALRPRCRRAGVGVAALAVLLAASRIAVAATPNAPTPLPVDGGEGAPLTELQWHGLLRARGQWIEGGSLGNGTSGLPTALSLSQPAGGSTGSGDRMAQADLRLRLTPALLLGSYARLDAMVDATTSTVLGSDPRQDSIDGRILGFEGSAPLRDALAVRRLWATFDVFGLATVEIGRMGDHFGMGLLRNDGRDPRADWQGEVDRVRIGLELFGFRAALMRDNLASLPMIAKGYGAEDPRYPAADATDVVRWLAEAGSARPADAAGLHWAVAVAYQDQAVDLALVHGQDPKGALESECVLKGTCARLVPRDATLVMPQAHVAWMRRGAFGVLRLEAEGAARVGVIDNTDALANTDTSKTLIQGGALGRVEWSRAATRWQLLGGYASGDGAGGFGVLDRQNLTASTPAGEVHRSLLTGFAMHRALLVDGLLYREVIGAVANTAFVRPAFRYDLQEMRADGGLAVELSLLVAAAARVGATPGRDRWLGLQPELRLDWQLGRLGLAIVQASLLLPGQAMAAGAGGKAAEPAFRCSLDWLTRF